MVLSITFQNGLTAVHIACKNGRRAILCSLLEKAKTQKHFCFKRSLPSDYDVAMSARAREVCFIDICMKASCYLYDALLNQHASVLMLVL